MSGDNPVEEAIARAIGMVSESFIVASGPGDAGASNASVSDPSGRPSGRPSRAQASGQVSCQS